MRYRYNSQEHCLSVFIAQVVNSQEHVRHRYRLKGWMPRNWTREKYSPITFWSGVPVKHQRYVPFKAKQAFAVEVLRVYTNG